jgi:cytoskeleton protein RodZ
VNESALNVGAELQRAREARGLALSEVAQQLKFAPRQLEALEQDRFDLLPGGTFARGMVRNYARLLKIDPEPLVRSLAERYDALEENPLADRYRQPVPFSDSARRSTLVYLGLSLGVLALGAGVAWQWHHERAAEGRPVVRAAVPAVTMAAAPAEKKTAPVAVAKKAPPAVAATAKESKAQTPPPATAPVTPSEAKPAVEKPALEKPAVEKPKPVATKPLPVADVPAGVHRLVIRCDEEAWIEVRDVNERALISSLNPAGSERVVHARGPLKLVIGNARHVQVLRDDQPIDLAPFIRVETARFTLP